MKFKASASFFANSGVVTFREGWRPVVHGTPTLTEWPVPFFFLFLVLGHSVRVGVLCFTGRQPSQNGKCHFSSDSGVLPFCEGWRPVF